MHNDEDEILQETACGEDIGQPDSRSMEEVLRRHEFDWDRILPDAKPVYWMGGTPVCTPGNLMTVTAPSKMGKSTLGGAIAASTMATGPQVDTLHVKSDNRDELAVIHFDTEQDLKRHEDSIRGIVSRAGRSTPPAWFHSYTVKGLPPPVLRAVLALSLAINKERHGGVHSVVLDGVADYIVDPNRAEECFPFITWLEDLAVRYNTVIICILHLNPVSSFGSGTKSRGHLGSQLERKVETEIRLKRDSDGAVSFWTYLARGKPISQESALRFKWSDEKGRHVSARSKQDERDLTRFAALLDEVWAIWGTDDELSYSEIVRRIAGLRKVSEKAAQRRHATLREEQLIEKTANRTWRVNPILCEAPSASVDQRSN